MTDSTPGATGIFGLGWGDEGKGKVVDLLCPAFDVVVRINGGANAGHTVCVGGERFALHLLPTGILHSHVTSVIGPGVVIDPTSLVAEIDGLAARNMPVGSRLKISDRAHLVLAYHKIEDQLSERAAGDDGKIGTTARGIGPCYADKMRRTSAVRVADLLHEPDLERRVRRQVEQRKALFKFQYGDDGGLDAETVVEAIRSAKARLTDFITDTGALLHVALSSGRKVLFEGANGILLDIDHGTYPFVTSSSTGPHVVGAGAGVSPSRLGRVIGVSKAYATRVGSGPFVTELRDEVGERIRQQGREFGTTTGRPRRCGWFDAVTCRYAVDLSAPTDLALLHLDTLSGLDRIGICTAYRLDGRTLTRIHVDARQLERAEPVIEFVPGWQENLRGVRQFEQLPPAAKSYVQRIEQLMGVPASIIGVGPDRADTILRGPLGDWISTEASASKRTAS